MIRRLAQLVRRLAPAGEGFWLIPLEGGLVAAPALVVAHVWPKPAGWRWVSTMSEAEQVARTMIGPQ